MPWSEEQVEEQQEHQHLEELGLFCLEDPLQRYMHSSLKGWKVKRYRWGIQEGIVINSCSLSKLYACMNVNIIQTDYTTNILTFTFDTTFLSFFLDRQILVYPYNRHIGHNLVVHSPGSHGRKILSN